MFNIHIAHRYSPAKQGKGAHDRSVTLEEAVMPSTDKRCNTYTEKKSTLDDTERAWYQANHVLEKVANPKETNTPTAYNQEESAF
jgi:hypothetical protein